MKVNPYPKTRDLFDSDYIKKTVKTNIKTARIYGNQEDMWVGFDDRRKKQIGINSWHITRQTSVSEQEEDM